MQFQFNTDDKVAGVEALAAEVEAEIRRTLGRFAAQITRIEVHLGDENAAKGGGDDKRCLLEARLAGRAPVAVTHRAATLAEAHVGAAHKMRRLLETSLGRLDGAKGGPSIRGGGPR